MTDNSPKLYTFQKVAPLIPFSRSGLRHHMGHPGGAMPQAWVMAGAEAADHMTPGGGAGSGRGGGRMFSAEAVVATVVSSELIRWGVRPPDAFRIGLHFVFSFAVPEGHPARCPLYADGETLLIVTTRTPCEEDPSFPGSDGFAVVSDRVTASLREEAMKARGNDAEPVLVLNLSSLCKKVAAGLGEDPDTFFRPTTSQAAAA